MNINEYTSWVVDFYKKRGWYQYDPFIRMGFLTEEIGELSRAVRSIEIGRDRPDEVEESEVQLKKHLTEELGDILGNMLIIADKYDISLEDIMKDNKSKFEERFR